MMERGNALEIARFNYLRLSGERELSMFVQFFKTSAEVSCGCRFAVVLARSVFLLLQAWIKALAGSCAL